MKTATIIFGSSTGNTEIAANIIKDNLNNYEVTLIDARDAYNDLILDSNLVIFGSSTWGYGELQDDFQEYYDNNMTKELINGKNFAVFGCGDSETFEDAFCQAVDIISQKVIECGGVLVTESLKIDGDPEDNKEQIVNFANKL